MNEIIKIFKENNSKSFYPKCINYRDMVNIYFVPTSLLFNISFLYILKVNEFIYIFDTRSEVEAFCSGFQVAKSISNNLIQSMPIDYEMGK